MNNFPITAVSPDRRHLDDIVRALQGVPGADQISIVHDRLRHPGAVTRQPVPKLLIAELAGDGCGELDLLERLGQVYPGMAIIVACGQHSPDFLIRAMRAGVREVLGMPLDAAALRAAVERIRRSLGVISTKRGKIMAFVSCKGGAGTTFLAANLAHALAAGEGGKVALFDFNLQFGDALLFVSDQTPLITLSDVARGIQRLDAGFLAASMTSVGPGLDVLAAPDDPSHGIDIKPEHIDALLKVARNQYDFILLDIGRNLDARTIKALDHADIIFTVLQLTLPFIRDGKRLLDIFRTLDYSKDKVQLVVNRHEKGGDIGVVELERNLGAKVQRIIPNHYEAVAASVDQGVPIARLASSSPVTKALLEWSDWHACGPGLENGNWISRMFKRA
jgi:pilus assembly protein CpaE